MNSEGAHKYDPIFKDMMPDTEQNRTGDMGDGVHDCRGVTLACDDD